jgi:RND family efflux transporter MFP subunit
VKEAEAGLQKAREGVHYWESETKRVEDLVRRTKVLNEQDLESTRYKFAEAKAGQEEMNARLESAQLVVREYEAQVRKASADTKVASARHQAAEADRDHVAAMLDYTRLEAPYKGVVIRRNVNTGDLFQPTAASGTKGEPLFVLARIDKLRVSVEVPETEAHLVNKGDHAHFQVRGLPGRDFEGDVSRSTVALDPRERVLRLEIDVKNPGELRPGMYAHASIIVEHPDVWTLPESAVAFQGEQAFCCLVQEGKIVRTPVEVGLKSGGRIEVNRRGGWSSADLCVAANPSAYTDGQPVQVNADGP